MMDREKVIKGLECRFENKPSKDCERCHYGTTLGRRWGCDFMRMCGDALALLKAQEPRVLTLEGAQGADYCWYESRTANICILSDATMYPSHNGKPKTELQAMGSSVRGWQYDDAYGKDWRCWDREPTKEQREAKPWIP